MEEKKVPHHRKKISSHFYEIFRFEQTKMKAASLKRAIARRPEIINEAATRPREVNPYEKQKPVLHMLKG
ncbi:hypothetical protein ACTRXD_22495 [Nitrospira sp. T9]|uniref:hypothetical protein n=1 Tax=unclassified Nitrospira TaxID=2652172 RepID=UPI003F9C2F18